MTWRWWGEGGDGGQGSKQANAGVELPAGRYSSSWLFPSLTGVQDVPDPGANPGGQPMVELATHCVGEVAPTVALTVKSGQGVHALAPKPSL